MKNTLFIAGIVVTGCAFASVHTNQWIGGETGRWNVTTSYSDGVVPGSIAGDQYLVELPNNLTVKVDVTDTESFATFNKILRIRPAASANSKIEISVDDAEATVEMKPAFTYSGLESYGHYGWIVKKGPGLLDLKSYKCCDEKGRATDYFTGLDVQGGILRLPDVDADGGYVSVGFINVEDGATVIISKGQTAKMMANVKAWMLTGAGTVTSEVAKTTYSNLRVTGYPNAKDDAGNKTYFGGEFSGVLANTVHWFQSGWCILSGTESTMRQTINVYDNQGRGYPSSGTLELAKFGNVGEPSSIGTGGEIELRENGAILRYVGSGESTDKNIQSRTTLKGPIFLDGGPHGGLVVSGSVHMVSTGAREQQQFVLCGTNRNACVFAGQLNTYTFAADAVKTNYDFHVIKRGSGTWRFADSEDNGRYRTFGNGITVEEGTLQFETIGEKGAFTSLGTALNLHANASGFGLPFVDYAFTLGAGGTCTAALEHVGWDMPPTATNAATTRPIVLNGRGTLRSNGAWLGMSDVSGLHAGDHTLVLDGTNMANNVVCDISDGPDGSKVSVEKVGSGKWVLGRDLSFSGSLDVKEGTLAVRPCDRYTWYRWTVEANSSTATNGVEASVVAQELAFFDKDGYRQNVGLTMNSNVACVAAGQIALDTEYGYTTKPVDNTDGSMNWRQLDCLCDDAQTDPGWMCILYSRKGATNGTYRPRLNLPATWLPVVVRLAPGAKPIASWDWAYTAKATRNTVTRNPMFYTLDASVDGLHWDRLSTHEIWQDYRDVDCTWRFSNTDCKANSKAAVHSDGEAIPSAPATVGKTLEKVASVSVAAGAVLESDGDPIALPDGIVLKVATAGNGALRGFAFPEEGTVEFAENPKGVTDVAFDLSAATGLENIANYTVTAGGVLKPNLKVAASATGIKVIHPGLLILFR